jgi:hypothetical protein
MDINVLYSNIQQIAKSYGLDYFTCQAEYTAPESQALYLGGSSSADPIYVDGRRYFVITWMCMGIVNNNELERFGDVSLNMIKNLEITNDGMMRFSGDFKIPISIEGEDAIKSRIIENIRKIAMQIRGTHMPVIPWPDAAPEEYNKYGPKINKYDLDAIAQDLKNVHGITATSATIPYPQILPPKVMKDISKAVDDELRDEFDPPLPKPQKRKIKLD